MGTVFQIRKGIITCHSFVKKTTTGYRLKDGTLLKGIEPKTKYGMEDFDVVTVTESVEEAKKFAKSEQNRIYDIFKVGRAALDDVETWQNDEDRSEDYLPESRIV